MGRCCLSSVFLIILRMGRTVDSCQLQQLQEQHSEVPFPRKRTFHIISVHILALEHELLILLNYESAMSELGKLQRLHQFVIQFDHMFSTWYTMHRETSTKTQQQKKDQYEYALTCRHIVTPTTLKLGPFIRPNSLDNVSALSLN